MGIPLAATFSEQQPSILNAFGLEADNNFQCNFFAMRQTNVRLAKGGETSMSGKGQIPVGEPHRKKNMMWETAEEADFYSAENPADGMNGQDERTVEKRGKTEPKMNTGNRSR